MGYARSSIEVIAAEAAVSTRTIYKHFNNKEDLFTCTLENSATTVADAFDATLLSLPVEARPIEAELVMIGRALARQPIDHPDHFAMVRQINAEAAQFPAATLQRWYEAGPGRVARAVATRLTELAGSGQLRIPDSHRAAGHFIAITTTEITQRSFLGAKPFTDASIRKYVTEGVAVFLDGYRPR